MKSHLGGREVQSSECKEFEYDGDNDRKLIIFLSLIFVSSHAVKMSFQAKFTFEKCKPLVAMAFEKKTEEVTREQMEDFVKEFCNLTAGALKKNLENEGFSSLISLPLLTRGQDEVFFKNHPLESDVQQFLNIPGKLYVIITRFFAKLILKYLIKKVLKKLFWELLELMKKMKGT